MTSSAAKSTKTTTRRVKSEAAGLLASARDIAGQVGTATAGLLDSMPGAAGTVKSSAMDAYRTVDSLSKPERKKLATVSLAVGGLLWLTGAPKLLTLLAFVPAVFVGGHRLASHVQPKDQEQG
jgi:hypothetical protein